MVPVEVSNTLIKVPYEIELQIRNNVTELRIKKTSYNFQIHTFSEAVANLVPCKFNEIQLRGASWAAMSTGIFSVSAKSTI